MGPLPPYLNCDSQATHLQSLALLHPREPGFEKTLQEKSRSMLELPSRLSLGHFPLKPTFPHGIVDDKAG